MNKDNVETLHSVHLATAGHEYSINIPMASEGNRKFALLILNDVRYHLERVTQNELAHDYKVDLDPDYRPQANATGHCYMLVPYSE